MSTFFLNGCNNENQAVKYFDSVYLPVQELIDLDTEVQENLFKLIISEDDLDSIDTQNIVNDEPIIQNLEKQITKLSAFINKYLAEVEDIEVIDDEENLKQSYIHLLKTYKDEIDKRWPKILSVINSKEVNQIEIDEFNKYLHQTQFNLDKSLNQFYDVAEFYASRHNIEIEKEF